MTTARERLAQGYYNSNPHSDSNPGGLSKGGHREEFPKALVDIGVTAKQVGDDAAVAAAAAVQSAAWLYEGNPGSVIRLSNTTLGIRGYNRTSIYKHIPNPRALRLIQSAPVLPTFSNTTNFASSPWGVSGAAVAASLSTPDPSSLMGSVWTLNEQTNNGVHALTSTLSSYKAGTNFICSIGLKANSRYRGSVLLNTAGGLSYLTTDFDLNAVAVANTSSVGGASGASAGIIDLSGGWYRVWLGGILSSSVVDTFSMEVHLADSSGSTSYQGSAGNGLYIWDGCVASLAAAPQQDNHFMYVQSSTWNNVANMTVITVTGGTVSPNFGAYRGTDTDGLYYGQDPANAPQGSSTGGNLFLATNYNAVGFNW